MTTTRVLTLLGMAALLACQAAAAETRSFAVYRSGELIAHAGSKAGFSCENDEDLAFVFTETVNDQSPIVDLTLREPNEEAGQVNVAVAITQTCGSGEATFDYRHDSGSGTVGPGGDLSISPEEFSITVPTEQGASGSRLVSYAALDDNETEDDETFTLFGDRIVFFIGNNAGQASERRDLAAVTVPANSEEAVDPDNLPDNASDQDRDSIDSLNDACDEAEEGSDLRQTCDEIADDQAPDDDGPDPGQRERARDIARAVDPSEVTEATAAALETIGRVQHENILNRLASVRAGSNGIEVSSLTLAMNGHTLDAAWIQDYLDAEEEAGGGSRLLSDRWGVFFNGSVSVGDQDFQQQSGYDYDIYDLTGGVDYRFENGLVLGGAIGLSRFESDIDEPGGALDSDSVTLQGFGTVNLTENFYIDATAAYASGEIDQTRTIDLSGIGSLTRQSVSGSADSTQVAASLSLNYSTRFGNGWSLINYGSLYFADTEVDELAEQGSSLALRFEEREFDSLLSTLGVRVSKVFNLENSVMTAFADLAYKHESKDAVNVETQFLAVNAQGPSVVIDDPDTNFGSAGFGASWVFPSGNQLFVRFNSLVLDSARTRNSIYIGGRMEF